MQVPPGSKRDIDPPRGAQGIPANHHDEVVRLYGDGDGETAGRAARHLLSRLVARRLLLPAAGGALRL